MSKTEKALEALHEIENNRRHLDEVSPDRLETMEENVKSVCESFFDSDSENTVRGFLGQLDLHFDPEDFMEHEESVDLPPEVIGVTVYVDRKPKMVSQQVMDEIMKKYIRTHTDIHEEEYFMIREHIQKYY